MTNRLTLYNAALREIGETRLANLTETRGPRYALDDMFDEAVKYCLEQGQWNFAMRTVAITADENVRPAFGYEFAHEKPEDCLRTCAFAQDPDFREPYNEYRDENGYWHSNLETIYVRYVSNGETFGLDLAIWPATFTRFVELYLASRICKPTSDSESLLERIKKDLKLARIDARSKDAMDEAPMRPPVGAWVRARSSSPNGQTWRKY